MTKTTLYRLYDQDGALLYVGVSNQWPRRAQHHAANKPWWGKVASAAFKEYPNRADALVAEACAIRSEQPRYNGRQPLVPRHKHFWATGSDGGQSLWCPDPLCPHPTEETR